MALGQNKAGMDMSDNICEFLPDTRGMRRITLTRPRRNERDPLYVLYNLLGISLCQNVELYKMNSGWSRRNGN